MKKLEKAIKIVKNIQESDINGHYEGWKYPGINRKKMLEEIMKNNYESTKILCINIKEYISKHQNEFINSWDLSGDNLNISIELNRRHMACFNGAIKGIITLASKGNSSDFWHELLDFIICYENPNPITPDEAKIFISLCEFGENIEKSSINIRETKI